MDLQKSEKLVSLCDTHRHFRYRNQNPLKRKKPNDLLKLIYVMLKDIKSGKD